ncbi:MAG: pyrroline-5-carboxylate reductase [Gammaproteobacteria bacterium]|nr:pyrroline-5-carboxylate reductase [Gammaproteobacteria bacterium]MDH5650415.1 pyrroline-5-carboxylate reductase [Gammaproteobacteria bacterium]
MMKATIGFIGGGNMARSLIGGLLTSGIAAEQIHVAEPDDQLRQQLHIDFGVHTGTDNTAIADQCDVIVLAVKPQMMKTVVSTLGDVSEKLLISIAAGIEIKAIEKWLGGTAAIVRTMPNTPALVKSGATGLYANSAVSETQKETAESILRAVGLTLWVADEALLDAVTALSGSGPAYFFLVMEAMEEAGIRLGLQPEEARLLAVQTAFGASKLALESAEDPATLRKRVTSPGGTTEQAIGVLQENRLQKIFEQAMTAARDRARELAEQLGS